jgi:hypothetical protein
VEREGGNPSKKVAVAMTAYHILNLSGGINGLVKSKACKFVNRFNHLTWTPHFQPKHPKGLKLLLIFNVISELLLLFFSYFAFRIYSFDVTLQVCQLTTYLIHLKVAIKEVFSCVLCLELKTRFKVLNKSLKSLGMIPEDSKVGIAGFLNRASADFANLTLALNEVDEHFGNFWLIGFSFLSVTMISLLGYLMGTTNPYFQYSKYAGLATAIFSFLAAVRIVTLCTILGDTSTQVCSILNVCFSLQKVAA